MSAANKSGKHNDAPEVATTDYDLTKAKILYPLDPPQPARNADTKSPRVP